MGFSPTIKSRAFIATIQIENMKKSGLSEEEYMNPEILAQSFTGIWNESGNNRTSAIAVCESKEGLYHAHMAIYGNPTTLKNAAKILFDSHVEPQLGGKKALTAYMTKEGSSANKGEKVLYTLGIENIMDSLQGKRNIFDIIDADIAAGKTPSEILSRGIAFYRYERIIKKAFLDKKIKKMAIMKELHTEWHCGTSGSGKSTLIKLILKEENPTSGNIIINGKDTTYLKPKRVPFLRRSMGVVFQDFRLLPDKTVYENVAFAMYIVKATPRHIRRQVPMVLSLVGLSNKAKVYPNELSGGEQQRVALARALVNNPSMLIADEPTRKP